METRTIFFIGKPGCGKGTQAKLLCEKTGWPIIGSGKQFRGIAAEDTPVGRKVKSEIDAGMLSPHWFAMFLYLKSLFALPEGESAIFDGFNRKPQEAQLIMDSLEWLGRPYTIFEIRISDEVAHARIEGRSKETARADDTAIEKRLEEYYTFTEPAITMFREAEHLIEIDGERPPEEIAIDIQGALKLS